MYCGAVGCGVVWCCVVQGGGEAVLGGVGTVLVFVWLQEVSRCMRNGVAAVVAVVSNV